MTKQGRASRQQEGGGRNTSTAGPALSALRRSAKLVGLLLVVLLVAGIGTVLRSPEPPARVYSAAEQAQLDAEERYRSLAAAARAAAMLRPDLAEQLTAVAADADVQADAVSLPRPPLPAAAGAATASGTSRPDPTDGGTGAVAGSPAPATPPSDGAQMVSMLHDSALRSLRDAVGAGPGPGRVLASAGANQWRHAVVLGEAMGIDPGLPAAESLSAAELGGAPHAADDTSGSEPEECAGTLRGSDADRRALRTAKDAEDRARYGYEVAAAQLEDRVGTLARAAAHGAAAEEAAGHLADLCVPAVPAPAGFAVGPALRADPAAALQELEQDHVALYAGLVAAVGPEIRGWAVAELTAAVQRSIGSGAALEPLPGLQVGSGTPDAAPSDTTSAPTGTAAPVGPSGG